MSILAAYAVPHPPLIIPTVGRGEERGIQDTIDAYRNVARRIAALRPETIVVVSPHAPLYRDAFHVTDSAALSGSMAPFGAPQTQVDIRTDGEFVYALAQAAEAAGIPLAGSKRRDGGMDHATFIPLWFANEAIREAGEEPSYRLVRVGLSLLAPDVHRRLGALVAGTATALGRATVLIASGDLSHKLKADGPYGFAPEGPVFDGRIAEIFSSGDLDELFAFDEDFCEAAAECGLRSFQIMTGALEAEAAGVDGACSVAGDDGAFGHELLSCEGPFGVGYAVAAFERQGASAKACAFAEDGDAAAAAGVDGTADDRHGERTDVTGAEQDVDPYVALARASVEGFVRTGRPIPRPDGLADELLTERAGVFVSLHEDGELRGCIGTIGPTEPCVADEIIQNGVSACSRDPRFPVVRPEELDFLEYSVDVLFPAEPVEDESELDPARYGVIVSKGWRRGLLLPNLEGVDTVAQQVGIAKRKAGIGLGETGVQLERFEVVRHNRGGEARRVR